MTTPTSPLRLPVILHRRQKRAGGAGDHPDGARHDRLYPVLQLRHRQTGQWFYRRSRQRGALYEPRFIAQRRDEPDDGDDHQRPAAGHLLGINGWAQSMGVGPCAVSLARWYGVKERGTFYGIWSTAHNIGEAVTYMVIAAVIAGFGWQMGYLSTAALGAAGVVLLVLFMHDSPQSGGFRPSTSSAMNRRRRSKPAARCLKPAAGAAQPGAVDPRPRLRLYVHRPLRRQLMGIFFLEQDKAYSTSRRPGLSASTLSPASPGPSSPACSPTAFPAQPQRDGRIHQPAEHRRLRPDALVAAQLLH